ncbi:MAG: KamA family radical SAM protein [Waddliaceae bacterium]
MWKDVPDCDWESWAWQINNRIQDINTLRKYLSLSPEEAIGCKQANKKLLFSITPYFFNLIDRENFNCPIRLQVIPRGQELMTMPEEMLDPVGEEKTMPVPGLVHRYPDRVLFLVTSFCGSYCRYCTRSRLVSNAQGYDFHPHFEQGIEYISTHQEVRDVLLSGGDPLLLSDKKIDQLLARLREIKHVEFIRIGTRIPVFMPQRITPNLCKIFQKHGPIWMSIHVNHQKECTLELREACRQLSSSWVVLGNQSVLLKGVNDNVETLLSLSHRLLQMGVRPYYLYQCDLITGSHHFRTQIQKGIEIMEQLRGHTTGYAVPQFVVDVPGGGGKIPVNPETIVKLSDEEVVLRNFQGKLYHYPTKPSSSPLKINNNQMEMITQCR